MGRHQREGTVVGRLGARSVARVDQQVAQERLGKGRVLRGELGCLDGQPHRRQGDVEPAVELGEVRHARQCGQVRLDREHLVGGFGGIVVPAELDQGVDDHGVRGGQVRGQCDRLAAGDESVGELVLPELEAADPGQDLGVIGCKTKSGIESCLGRGVERWVRGLADPLEEREPEIALGGLVGRVRGDRGLEPGDRRDRRRDRRGGKSRRGCGGGRRRLHRGRRRPGGRRRWARWPDGRTRTRTRAADAHQRDGEEHGGATRPRGHGRHTPEAARRMTDPADRS